MNKSELKQNWNNLLSELVNYNIDPIVIATFFAPLSPYKFMEDTKTILLVAEGESGFYHRMVNNHSEEVEKASEKLFGYAVTLCVIENDGLGEEEIDEQQKEDYLNPKYTFASFVQGPTNRMACAAAMAMADGYSKNINPLFIYSGSGLGKTHLMHAIGHYVRQYKPKKKILYVNAETFMSELSEAIRTRRQKEFKDKYRKVDYLLFDDVQFIAGQKFVEEELFNTFEALYNNKKQMIFTSDRPPKELGELSERLSSRFVWGLTVDIQIPDYETRMAILKNKALLENIEINEEVIAVFDIIARNVDTNIRELEGAFTRVVAFASINNEPISLKLAKSTLTDLIKTKDREINVEVIKKEVADYFCINVADLNSSKRNREISYPRHIAIYLTRTLLGSSYPVIGKAFGGKDHTSIMHSVSVIEDELKYSDELNLTIKTLKEKLKG